MAFSYGPVTPAVTSKPLAFTYDATVSSSTPITLNAKTTGIEVTAIDKAIFLKWDGTASNSSFDGVIGPGITKIFAVPTGTVTANFIEQASAAILICIEF